MATSNSWQTGDATSRAVQGSTKMEEGWEDELEIEDTDMEIEVGANRDDSEGYQGDISIQLQESEDMEMVIGDPYIESLVIRRSTSEHPSSRHFNPVTPQRKTQDTSLIRSTLSSLQKRKKDDLTHSSSGRKN